MKHFLLATLICYVGLNGYTQIQHIKIVDEETNNQLEYVVITFSKGQSYHYSDSNGVFRIDRKVFTDRDTVHFYLVGYEKHSVQVLKLLVDGTMRMKRTIKDLGSVEVVNCDWNYFYKDRLNDKIKLHGGVTPGIILVRIGAYKIESSKRAYLEDFTYHVGEWAQRFDIPFRLHWYEWDTLNKKPGKEITDTNLIFYPSKKRWNKIELPGKRVMASNGYLVIGFEHLYPQEMVAELAQVPDGQKTKWYGDNSWAYGLTKDEAGSFEQMKGTEIYKAFTSNKPAIRFKMRLCK